MIQLFKMALRNLGRNRRRSFFSALALGVGLALLLLMASVVQGEMKGALDTALRLQSGHLQVRAKDYNEDKNSLAWKDLVEDPEQIAQQVASLAPVQVATPRLFISGIVASGDESVGVRVIGIDPQSAASTPYREGVVSGSYLSADDRDGILIGQPLADKLQLKAGDPINLLVNTSNGDVSQQNITIRGVYSTRTPSFDEGTAFLSLGKAQALVKAENHASAIFIMLKDATQTQAVADALKSDRYAVKTWSQMNSLLTDTEQFSRGYMMLLYLIILMITATVIVNTLIMAVFERTREIGILTALGMKGRSIVALFFAESSLLGIGGIVMGLLLGGLFVAYATKFGFYIGNIGTTGITLGDTIYAQFNPQDAVTLTIMAFVMTLLAAIYPALLASRLEPVDALRGGAKTA